MLQVVGDAVQELGAFFHDCQVGSSGHVKDVIEPERAERRDGLPLDWRADGEPELLSQRDADRRGDLGDHHFLVTGGEIRSDRGDVIVFCLQG